MSFRESLSPINGGRGLRTGAELFCQEFMPVTTPLFCKYSENIKNIAGVSGPFGTLVLVFKMGGKSAMQEGSVRTKKIVKK